MNFDSTMKYIRHLGMILIMCTLVLLYRPENPWPVIVGTNRDEMADRPWLAPGRHWPDRPDVVAGMDQLCGGSWLGLNDTGVVAGINNREGSLGQEQGKRSRGELVLEALDHYTAADASEALSHLEPAAYRPFNLMIADSQGAYWLSNVAGAAALKISKIPPGVSMITARDLNDNSCSRIRSYLPRFEKAVAPDPQADDWSEWEMLLSERAYQSGEGVEGAMLIRTEHGFNTLSSSLIAIPAAHRYDTKPVWRFARRYPRSEPYQPVDLA
jgi:uncharacterized protein with NRDE domain